MSQIVLTKQNASEVETPQSGKTILFVDEADDKIKAKLDTGDLREVIYASIGPPVDKNHVTPFVSSTVVNVTHNLDKIPSVVVLDSTGKKIDVGVVIIYDLLDINNKLTVQMDTSLTGKVVCN